MQRNKISILSTSSLNTALIQEAAKKNVFIDELSFIDIVPIDDSDVKKIIQDIATTNKVVVFTSRNAVEIVDSFLQSQQPDWKIYCVGNTTKELIKQFFGERSIIGFASHASELAQIILDNKAQEVFFFCGDKRRDELPVILNDKGVVVREIRVYETITTPHLLNKNYDGVLFFSPSGVESFFTNNTIIDQTILFTIGKTTADEIRKWSNNNIIICEEPGKENLFRKMMNYYY